MAQQPILAILRCLVGLLALGLALPAIAQNAPTISIWSPGNNSTLVATEGTPLDIAVWANISTDGTLANVEYYNGTTLLGVDNGPYFGGFTLHNAAPGSYTLTAKATDNQGASATSSPVTFTVIANQAPTISLTAPSDGQVIPNAGNVTLSATVADADGSISKVEYYYHYYYSERLNGYTRVGSTTSPPYNVLWPNLNNGSYTLTAKATDNRGVTTTSAPITFQIGAIAPPTVSLTAPAANSQHQAGSNLVLTADAADQDGMLSQVAFYQNGTLIGAVTQAPYAVTWNNVPAGHYTLTAIASNYYSLSATSAPAPITVGSNSQTTKIYYLHSDHLDTPREVTDEQGQIVWRNGPLTEPFGNSPPEEDPDGDGVPFTLNLRFPGQYFDKETNLHYNYYRDYDPLTGRYIQSDPIGLEGGSMSLYVYVNGSPLSYIDPEGLTSLRFDPVQRVLVIDPEVKGRRSYTMPASSGSTECGCSPNAQDKGPIPSGLYDLDTSQLSNPGRAGDLLRNLRGDWGDWRVPLTPAPGTITYGRSGFFLHGGGHPGSAGCIDVGGGVFGNDLTNQLLRDLLSDPDGRVPVNVIWPSLRVR